MKNEKIAEALNVIDDNYLTEVTASKPHRPYWIGAVAAILVLVIAISIFSGPQQNPSDPNLEVPDLSTSTTVNPQDTSPTDTPNTPLEPEDPVTNPGGIDFSLLQGMPDLLRAPIIPNLAQFPLRENFENREDYNFALDQWKASQSAQFNQPEGYADGLTDFFRRSIREFLSGEENGAYSPVNVYLAMAMLAETTDGNSRQQILNLFGVSTIEELRTQVAHLWNAHYNNDGQTTLLLANSLWLDDAFSFRQEAVDRLANDYYASVFGGDLGTDASNAQLQQWLNAMTGGLLEKQTKNVKLDKNAVFALASTIYFKAGWTDEFQEELTTDDTFHSPDGDITAAFMHSNREGTYYQGSNFGAICLALTGENDMWIILPNEGVTVAEVMAGDEYLSLTLDPDAWFGLRCILEISLPKFDVNQQSDLIKGMQNLGITDVFYPGVSDFSPLYNGTSRLFVSQINHAARVVIDEEGVIAAAFTVIEVGLESVGPSAIIEFNANRPFLFIVSSRDHLPMFAGVVTEP